LSDEIPFCWLFKQQYGFPTHLREAFARQTPRFNERIHFPDTNELRAFFGVKPETVGNPFFSHLPRFDLTSKLKAFFTSDVLAATFDHDPLSDAEARLPAAFHGWNAFAKSQYLETRGLMPGYILSSQGDRMTMANSIEGRVPFLDHRLVEFGAKLPPRLKMAGLDEKHILKNATKHLVPDSIRQRAKQPYRAPDAHSFFDTDTGMARFEYVDAMLSSSAIADAGLFDPDVVSKLVEKARSGAAIGTKDNMALVGILSAQLVVEQFVNGRPVDVPGAISVWLTERVESSRPCIFILSWWVAMTRSTQRFWKINMPAIETDVRDFVTDNFLFGRKNVSLAGDDSLLEEGLIDSTGVLELVMFIEEKFDVTVEDEDLVPDNLDSINCLISFIESKLEEAK
jgi:acyl carrier protein